MLTDVQLCGSRYLITDSDVKHNVEPCRKELEDLGITIAYYNPSSLASLSDNTPIPNTRRETISIESVRSLIYTSGTTGLPKAVITSTGKELLIGFSTANPEIRCIHVCRYIMALRMVFAPHPLYTQVQL
jgi:acyl-CoA synthetase (AMP-forming)/AMP-acid ligase II